MIEHKRQNKPSQVVLADKILHPRRQQQRLIDRPRAKSLAHNPSRIRFASRRQQNPLLLGQAPRRRGLR